MTTERHDGAVLPPPHALLLDFGGVLVDTPGRPSAPTPTSAAPELVQRLHALVDGTVAPDRISRDLVNGHRAYARWRDEESNTDAPAELSHRRVWHDFVVADWPEPAKAAVLQQATALAYAWTWRLDWQVRPGIPAALKAAADAGLPMAVVSNTLCGAAHRDFLARAGLAGFFTVQHYSDEAGTRKPNPAMALRAARDVGVPIDRCWFVGDSLNRDIACARRAATGAAVLMRSPRTDREGPMLGIAPDATVDDGHGLRALLATALGFPRQS
jgi:HAD superfamily hydrolase (TIGR01549 family)